MGIETNIVTLCTDFGNRCHSKYDNGTREERDRIDKIICAYMKGKYGDGWSKEDQVYRKYGDLEGH